MKAVLIWVSNIISMVAYHKCTIIALSGNEITPIIPSHLKYHMISCCWGCYEKIATRTWSWEQPKQPVDSCSYFNRVFSNSYLVKSLLTVKCTYLSQIPIFLVHLIGKKSTSHDWNYCANRKTVIYIGSWCQ